MTVIAVRTSAQPYDVVVGPLESGLDRLAALAADRPLPLVSDAHVLALHGAVLRDRFDIRPILVPRGEAAKNWAVLHDVLAQLADLDPTRTTPMVALGGGSVGDVAGLAASLFKRGLPLVHIPTTLLAQADSAVGGKTAIDFAGQKNLVGSFLQPALVLADPALLVTLDDRQRRAGLAEVFKYGLIDDPAFFAWCEDHALDLLAGHRDNLSHALCHAIAAKARLVEGDEHDLIGRRALLNFGHSFAHAIEAEAGLGAVLHGEAVAAGMVLALRLSAALGLAPAEDANRLAALNARVRLPASLAEVGLAGRGPALLPHIARDKKRGGEALTLILARGIGGAFVEQVPAERLAAFLAAL